MQPQHQIVFKPKNKKTTVPEGTSILDAALEIGLTMRHNCGAQATCGTCRVQIEEGFENISPVNDREMDMLGDDRIGQKFRLGCQSRIYGPVTARIPTWLPVPLPDH